TPSPRRAPPGQKLGWQTSLHLKGPVWSVVLEGNGRQENVSFSPMANVRGGGGLRSPDARRKLIMGGTLLVLIPIVGFVLYTFMTLSWSYSDGDRTGYLQ